MGTKGALQPPFTFPAVAWAPEPGTGSPCDDGIRELLTPRDLTSIYFPETDLRLGWTFVDAEGRCWKAVSSRVTGRADPWWTRALPKWLHHPRYRLDVVYAERPPVPFDKVKTRLFAAVSANPQAYGGDYGRSRREELRAAGSLRDLIKSHEELAIARLQPSAWWKGLLLWEGRCSRLTFLTAGAVVATLMWFAIAWRLPMPSFLIILLLGFSYAMSVIVRRLHDLRRTGWWTAIWLLFNMVCAQIHDSAQDPTIKATAAVLWQAATMAALAFLAVAPGTRGANRYGFAPRWDGHHQAASDSASA